MADPRRRFPTRHLTALAAFLCLAALADTALWAVACSRLDAGARDAAAQAGWTLTADPARWSGWPLAAAITLPNATAQAGPDVLPPITWTAAAATLRLAAFHPMTVTVSAAGQQTIAIAAGTPLPFTARHLQVAIDLTAHDPVHATAEALDLAAPGGPVRVDAADLTLLPDGMTADLAGTALPSAPLIDSIRLHAHIAPPVQPEPTAADSARHWRDAGGRLDLELTSLRWGALDARASAAVSLDAGLQPAMEGQLTASGLASVIDRLAASGAITRSAATAAGGVLAILSAPSGGGPVTLPVTLRTGILSVARIPLLRLAPLRWD